MTPLLIGLGLAIFGVLLGRWLFTELMRIERGDYDP